MKFVNKIIEVLSVAAVIVGVAFILMGVWDSSKKKLDKATIDFVVGFGAIHTRMLQALLEEKYENKSGDKRANERT